jgi:hypothetical protein
MDKRASSDFLASWSGGESPAMRIVLIASIVVLFVGCGHQSLTAPTPPVVPTPAVTPAPAVLGTYKVVFVADAACTELPPVVRTRTYTGAYDGFFVHLSGSDFSIPAPIGYYAWDVIHLEASKDSATAYFSDPPIWERPTSDTDLMIEGNAKGTVSSDGSQITFAFPGTFMYCPAVERAESRQPKCEVPRIRCESKNHQLTLSRE